MTFKAWSWTISGILFGILAGGFPCAAAEPEQKAPAKKTQALPWLASLAEGYALGQRLRQPVLVRVGSESCPWCRKLDEEIAKLKVQDELARWTLVALDLDKSKDVKALAIGPIPALRVLTPGGRLVASHDGYLPADDLIAWLRKHHDPAAVGPSEELIRNEAPNEGSVPKLIEELKSRDAVFREAAIRRLRGVPEAAAVPVVQAFAAGPLQVRLAALELLQEWQAPVKELDPWRPETVTEARLQTLRNWSANPGKLVETGPQELKPIDLAAARQEIARMLQAAEAEAAASRERLARLGRALLPEIHAQLKQATTDSARERLTALRYRLAATDALALGWPGGFDRLASMRAATRHQAIQELARRATAAEEPLLLELFSNPDPLVREISLRALHDIAGPRATASLTRLLNDPEPNVRAAVLKQLAEQPAPAMVARIAEYVAGEKDPDLVGHAARVLRATKGKASIECLKTLLKHESWRVRAEATESLGECAGRYDSGLPEDVKNGVYTAIIEMLKDSDGFVIGRAVGALKKTDLAASVDPMAEAAQKHPELAAEIVKAMAYGNQTKIKAIPHLRKFCAHEDAPVRAAAIFALCGSDAGNVEKELRAALEDKNIAVRRSAAQGFFQILEGQRTQAMPDGASPPEGVLEKVTALFQSERNLPKWMKDLAGLVQPLLSADEVETRLAGALPLIALGQDAKATPVLLEAVRKQPALLDKAPETLAWLPWPKRLELFQQLVALRPSPEHLSDVINGMVRNRDKRALQPLWDLAAADKVPEASASTMVVALLQLYFGPGLNSRTNNRLNISAADRKEALTAAKQKATSGPTMQRVIALAVLVPASLDEAVAIARAMYNDPKTSPALRQDALTVMLLGMSKIEGRKFAISALSHAEPGIRNLAISILTFGFQRLQTMHEEIYLTLEDQQGFNQLIAEVNSQPSVPEPPRGLTLDMLRPLLKDSDPRTAACAGYLMALLGNAEGLDILVHYWREQGSTDDTWLRLVYRAVAALGDDSRARLLEEIYRGYPREEAYRVREFYWTIRGMTGPQVMKLRKLIRQEVGMQNLQ